MNRKAEENVHLKSVIDAKIEIWLSEQKAKLHGLKITDKEIEEYIRKNKHKWEDKE